jgi:membrane protease subunit HflK
LQKFDPPTQVVDAFRDVQRANADRERLRNEAESYRNDIIPRARGEAERVVQEAEGVRESQIARARGEAQRFVSVLSAYQVAQDVTLRRMYIETMEGILRHNPKVLVDTGLQGIVPLLNLGEGGRGAPTPPTAAAAAAAQQQQLLRPPPTTTPRPRQQGTTR